MEYINVLVCELNFMFYDDRHWLLALLATGSVMPFFYLGVVDNRRLMGGVVRWNDSSAAE